MRIFSKLSERRPDQVAGRVIFVASRAAIARVDVRLGPCFEPAKSTASARGRVASLWAQYPDPIESVGALFRVLAPEADAPWEATTAEPPGTLYKLGFDFVDALADLSRRSYAADPDHPSFAPYREAAARWLTAFEWPRHRTIDALVGRLIRDAADAVDARRLRRGLYCWCGPLVLDASEDGRTGSQILKMRGD